MSRLVEEFLREMNIGTDDWSEDDDGWDSKDEDFGSVENLSRPRRPPSRSFKSPYDYTDDEWDNMTEDQQAAIQRRYNSRRGENPNIGPSHNRY